MKTNRKKNISLVIQRLDRRSVGLSGKHHNGLSKQITQTLFYDYGIIDC